MCTNTTNTCGCNEKSSVCLSYQGQDLTCIPITCGTTYEGALVAINQKICDIVQSIIELDSGGSDQYVLELNGNDLNFLKNTLVQNSIDLSKYLDNVNLQSLSIDNNTKILTATLTNALSTTVDLSGLFTPIEVTNISFSGTTTKTLTLSQSNGNNLTASFVDDSSTGAQGIQSVQAGTNVTVDNTDPDNPIVNATDTNSIIDDATVTGDINKTLTITDTDSNLVTVQFIDEGIRSIQQGSNITVDNTDPYNPIVSGTANTTNSSLTVTGTTTKTITLVDSAGGTLQANFTDNEGLQSVQAGTNITINNTDPDNPIISSTGSTTNLSYNSATNTVQSSTGTGAVIPLSSNVDGLMPANFNVLNSFTNPNQFTNNSGSVVLTNSTGSARVQFFRTGLHTTLIFFDIDLSFTGGTTVDLIKTDIGSYGGSLGTLSTLNIFAKTGGVITQFDNSAGTVISDLICYVQSTSLYIERIDGGTITVPNTGLTFSLNVTFPNNF